MKYFLPPFAALALIAAKPAPEPATIYSGGPIITMAGDTPETVEAIAVKDGKITALGNAEAVFKQAGKKAKRIDLRGRTLLPGFIDAHGHVSYAGQNAAMAQLQPPPVGGVDTITKLQAALRVWEAQRRLPEGAPIVGNGFDDSQLTEGRFPTRHDLDAVSASRPILIIHVSGHLAVANSAMLTKIGVGPDSQDPKGGHIRREADGKTPDGVLEETALFLAMSAILPSGIEQGLASLVTGANQFASYGITTAQDGRAFPESWAVLAEASKRNMLPIDIAVLASMERNWPEDVRAQIGNGYVNRLRIAGIKLTLDGSPQGRTAWLHDPVPVPPEGKGADYRGYPAIDLNLFNAKLAEAAAKNWQVFVHVNGDEAAQALIDGVRSQGLAGKRTIAIHNQVVRPEQLAEMKKLDIQPSFFANHTYYWGDWHRDVALGPKRADFISPQASAWNLGLRPTAHNDSPVVPPDIMRLIWSSVNRRSQSGDILGPMERIPVYRALQQVTINAAWQIHEDSEKGSLEIGKRADLVVLDANPLSSDPANLHAIKVVATIKDGKTVFGSAD
ncbi:amidohydrolase [uncultured Sphingorhabdus sp.]|uniref:amidohydrolase n=1 Tax=uncultured Sphingorhabdus sp. TaxID=1686106 RepID=UPI00260FE2A0|nr:amidohydrolase [uncultured Sphingorhabdus sp.]HMS19881.1 amidohydrolase [Sphingorhabdus sp.]